MWVFVFTAVILSAPWYIRSWTLTGNPFYSNPVGDLFPTNPIHVGFLRSYASWFGFGQDPLGRLYDTANFLFSFAPLQALFGVTASVVFFRQFGYLAVGGGLVVVVWIYSVGQTAGGLFYSMRVLNPVLVVLSVLAGVLLDGVVQGNIPKRIKIPLNEKRVLPWITEERHRAQLVVALLTCLCIVATIQNLVVPVKIWEVPPALWLRPSFWVMKGFTPADGWPGSNIGDYDGAKPILAKARVLSHVPYLHAQLYPTGSSVVPFWSPEVRFLFDQDTTPKTACKTLQKLGIKHIYRETSPYSLTSKSYLDQFPFFVQYPSSYVPSLEQKGRGIFYRIPPCDFLDGK